MPQRTWQYTVQAASKAPGGGRGPPVNLSPPGEEALALQVAVNAAGRAVALWYHLANDETIKAAVRTPQGNWGAPVLVSLPGRRAYEHLDVAIEPAGNAVAIWVSYDAGPLGYLIEAATKPAGGSWTPPVELFE